MLPYDRLVNRYPDFSMQVSVGLCAHNVNVYHYTVKHSLVFRMGSISFSLIRRMQPILGTTTPYCDGQIRQREPCSLAPSTIYTQSGE